MYSWPRLWNRLKLNPNTAGFWHVPCACLLGKCEICRLFPPRLFFFATAPPPCLLAGGQYWLQGARILQEEISRWSNIHRLFQSNQVDAVLFYDAELPKISMLVAKPKRTKMDEAMETSLWHTVIDHNDPSKPSHRLTNGPEPSKTI